MYEISVHVYYYKVKVYLKKKPRKFSFRAEMS